jgi:hypothetical protein
MHETFETVGIFVINIDDKFQLWNISYGYIPHSKAELNT